MTNEINNEWNADQFYCILWSWAWPPCDCHPPVKTSQSRPTYEFAGSGVSFYIPANPEMEQQYGYKYIYLYRHWVSIAISMWSMVWHEDTRAVSDTRACVNWQQYEHVIVIVRGEKTTRASSQKSITIETEQFAHKTRGCTQEIQEGL